MRTGKDKQKSKTAVRFNHFISTNMKNALDLIYYLTPALLVLIAAIYTLRTMLKNEQKRRAIDLALKNQQIITPIRLQAYERLVLFMERITPANLLMRLNPRHQTVQELQRQLLQTIRSEFDHNLTQQLYVSPKAWSLVKSAREQQTQFINSHVAKLKPTDSGMKLSTLLIEEYMALEKSAPQVAIDFLRQEMRQYF
jgi:hypothetical protein